MFTTRNRSEEGASAILVAASLLLLVGMAAVAIDLGAGFNARRQDQTAADLAATTAAIEAANQTIAVTEALEVARSNLDATFSDSEWQTIWEGCTDPDRPVGFYPLPNVFPTPGTTDLDCMSVNPAGDMGLEFRVRVPDQLTATTFGRTFGIGNLTTSAAAHSQLVFSAKGDVLPFGLLNNTPTGSEQCILQPPGGLATGACVGGTSGNFGTVQMPGWGNPDKGTTVNCNRSDTGLIAQNMAIGQDHILLPATGADGQVSSFPGTGGPHPGAIPEDLSKKDACTSSSGDSEPTDLAPVSPLNTVDTTTGSSSGPLKMGLIGDPTSDPTFPGGLGPRLRSTTGDTLYLREKSGGDQIEYEIDNTALWSYLVSPSSLGGWSDFTSLGTLHPCHPNQFQASDTYTDKRTSLMACLAAYQTYLALPTTTNPVPLFTDDIVDSKRFGWTPRFHYTTWGSGTSWQPIHSFEVLYLDGMWFNCNGSGNGPNTEPCSGAKGVHFYPQENANGTILKAGNGPYGGNLRLDQMTAIPLPIEAMPAAVIDTYPGTKRGPFRVQIIR